MTPEQFKLARKALGLSQASMSKKLRLGSNGARTVRRWELAEREIPGPVEALIEEWLGHPISELPDTT